MSKKNKHKNFTQSPEIQVEFIKTSKLGQFSFYALKVLVYASFLAPISFFWSKALVEFLLPKNVLFIALSALTAFFLIVHFIENRPIKISKSQKLLFILFGAWLLARLCSLFMSFDVVRSFWGGPTRYEGDILFFGLSVFAIACTQIFKTKKQINRFLLVVSLAAGLFALYGVMQKLGIFVFGEHWVDDSVSRASSVFGNPLYLSSFLVITLFFTVYSWWQKDSRSLKYELLFSAIIQVVAIVFAECSSTYIGLAAAIFLFFTLFYWDKKKLISIILLAAAFLGAVCLTLTSMNVVATPTILRPALKDFNIQTQSNIQRYYLWVSFGRAFREKPLLGWGNEMEVYVYNQFRDNRLAPPLEYNFDRAHNFILDQLANNGLIGCGLLFALLFYASVVGYKKYRQSARIVFLILAIVPANFVVDMFFSIPIISNYLLLFLAIGLIFSREEYEELIVENKLDKKSAGYFTVLFIGSLWLVCFAFEPLYSMVICKDAVLVADTQTAHFLVDKSLDIWVFEETVLTKLQLYIREMKKTDDSNLAAIAATAGESARYWAAKYPFSSMVFLKAGEIYSYIDENEMDNYFSRSLELAPTDYDTYWAWGDAYFRLGEPEKAVEKYQAAIDLNPDAAYPREKLEQLKNKLIK
jgi:O-antigen ligase